MNEWKKEYLYVYINYVGRKFLDIIWKIIVIKNLNLKKLIEIVNIIVNIWNIDKLDFKKFLLDNERYKFN